MSKLTDEQWVELNKLTIHYAHNHQRMGQAYMNALHSVNEDLYNEITATDADPFYIDDNITKFMEFLTEEKYGV